MSQRVGWLPGLQDDPARVADVEGVTPAGARFSAPALSAAQAAEVASSARAAALAARRTHTIADVIAAVSRAALRLADPADAIGAEAVDGLIRSGGVSPAAARDLLARHAEGWTADALAGLVRSELGNPRVLDAPLPDPAVPARRRHAVGPPVQHLVLAGNVPGVAVTAVVRGLLVRSAVLCKLPRSEPWLVGLFARALDEDEAPLARCVAATWWPGGDPAPAAGVWAKHAGKVIVYGGEESVREARSRTPAHVELIEYGPRLGTVFIGGSASDEELDGLASDVFAYDQAGCVSPRLVYVLCDSATGDADGVIERLAEALGRHAKREPGWRPRDDEAVAIRAARAEFQFGDPTAGEAHGPTDLSWTLLFRGSPGTRAESLPRTVWAYRLRGADDLPALAAVLEGRVQAIAHAGLGATLVEEVERLAIELGACRVSPVGTMAWPPADWRHDGRRQLEPLLRWTDFEYRP